MFAYEYSFSELVQEMEFTLVDCKTRCSGSWCLESLNSIILASTVACSDIGDRRRCSRVMQVLQKRFRCRYSPRNRKWWIF